MSSRQPAGRVSIQTGRPGRGRRESRDCAFVCAHECLHQHLRLSTNQAAKVYSRTEFRVKSVSVTSDATIMPGYLLQTVRAKCNKQGEGRLFRNMSRYNQACLLRDMRSPLPVQQRRATPAASPGTRVRGSGTPVAHRGSDGEETSGRLSRVRKQFSAGGRRLPARWNAVYVRE